MPITLSDFLDFPFNGGKGIRKAQVEGLDGIEHEVDELRDVTHDLHAGTVHSGWAAVNSDGSEGGIAVIDGNDPLAEARAVSAWAVTLDENLGGETLVVRVPHGTSIASYRADIAAIGGGDYYDDLTRYRLIGSDDANSPTWDYHYYGGVLGSNDGRITLQITGSSAASGSSTFSGNLVLAKVLAALGVDSISDLGGGADPLIENVFDGTTGNTVGEQEVAGVTIENLANVAYSIRVGAETEFTLGNAFRAVRSGSPLQVNHANFYTKANDDKLYRTLDAASDATLEIWQVNDLAALRAALAAASPAPASDSDAATPMFEQVLDSTLGSSNAEVDLGVTIENDANVSYLVQVGDRERYILGNAFYATRAATPVSLGPAHFYSKGGGDAGKLYQDIQTSWVSSTVLRIWKVNDVSGLTEILHEFEPDHVDELRADLTKLHTYIAEHVTTTSTEVMDPTQADSPAHYYLTKRARHTVNGVSVPFETGLYELTAGVANKVKVKLAKSGNWWGVNTREYGGTPNRGSILHNPLSMLVAWWVDQDSGGDHWMHAVIKGRVYDLLRTRYNLANTAIFFRATDGSNEHWFEMGQVGETNIGGDQFYLMRDHLTPSPSLRDGFLAWFTAGNENAPTIDIAFNQSFPDAGRDNSPVGYTIAGSGTTKAYTFRADNFAGITGLNDQFIESASIDRKVVLTQAQYDALAAKDARTEYCIVG